MHGITLSVTSLSNQLELIYLHTSIAVFFCRVKWFQLFQSNKYNSLPSQLGLQNTLTAPLKRGKTPLMSVLDMTLNNLMVRIQQCWSFGECGVPLHCHCSRDHSGPEW